MTTRTSPGPLPKRQFASDNYAGLCPEAFEAISAANQGHAVPYGDDAWTKRACDLLRDFFETDCEVYFVFNGTAANSLALAGLCQSYHSVICHEAAHIETDECGAPEFFTNGTKILTVGGMDGKLDLQAIERTTRRRTDIHYPKPRVLSITQATELGTVYSPDELRATGELAGRLGLSIHMDGARLANALATLNVAPKEITWKIGVDVLCLGGAKNGMAIGEAVVFFNRDKAAEFDYRCKQAGQLGSKMRFISAPWAAMIESGAYLRRARHANQCAARLERSLRSIPGIGILFPRQANSVFVQFPQGMAEALQAGGWTFYTFIGVGGARLMCSWDTDDADVDALLADIRTIAAE